MQLLPESALVLLIGALATISGRETLSGPCSSQARVGLYRTVPATAPDSAPTDLWNRIVADSNVISGGADIGGTMVRDLVYVQFREHTPQVGRQKTIDDIDGEVVGGMRIGGPEFFYAVRIPYCLKSDERPTTPVFRAIATLRKSPFVHRAIVASMDPNRSMRFGTR